MGRLFSELKKLNSQKDEIKARLKDKTVVGAAGGDFVQVTGNLLGEILKIEISDELFAMNDKKMIEDLVLAAANDAIKKGKEQMMNEGLDLPDDLKQMIEGLGGQL